MAAVLNDFILPGAMVISAVPILVAAILVARGNLHLVNGLDASRLRDPAATAARLARLLAMVAIALLSSALGFYWAAGDHGRTIAITLALLVVVNGLAVALILAAAKARREYRDDSNDANGPRRERTRRR